MTKPDLIFQEEKEPEREEQSHVSHPQRHSPENFNCIIDYVEESARQRPDVIALVEHSTGRQFTFSQLMSLASKLAVVLKKTIVYPAELVTGEETPLVSFLTERGLVSLVCILAILKAGAAYVPVDNSFPEDRQEYIFEHSQCQLVILDKVNEHRLAGIRAAVPSTKVIVINNQTGEVEEDEEDIKNEESSTIARRTDLRSDPSFAEKSLAYVLYTSGSTGKPKGVMVKNKGLLNVVLFFEDLLQMRERTERGEPDRVLGLTTLCFDISMLEVFMPLLSGATLVLVNSVVQKNPVKILDVIEKERISVMQATPTTYEMLIGCGWGGDRNIRFLVGGEACRPKISALAQHCGARFYNVYGPTETSIWSSSYLLPTTAPLDSSSAESLNISVGKPLWKTQFYVVDEKTGEDITASHGEGELWIGGDGVALGYLHAPDLTEKRFLKNPWGPGMVYRTGDLFKMRPEDGNFIFVRRMDDQVKVKGYRIELGEVELAIADHPAVEQAVVIVKDDALWGFVKVLTTSSEGEALKKGSVKVLTKTMQDFARKKLPPYMIPKLVVPMDSFPTTANGKLDRLTLSKMDLTVYMMESEGGEGQGGKKGGSEDHSNKTEETQVLSGATSFDLEESNHKHHRAISMVKYVKAQVSKVSGQSPSSHSSFAAVGIDSLAAMMFRNLLSQSLGGVKIDPEVLYNPDTTIESFSKDLYNQLQTENPSLLLRLNITSAVDEDLEEGGGGGKQLDHEGDEESEERKESPLGKALLIKRNWIEGLRGICMILVIIDHFFFFSAVGGNRLHADTVLFVAISGMTMGLQDLSQCENVAASGGRRKFQWDFWSFLYSRFVGLFPLLWLVIILSIPVLYLLYYTYNLSTSNFVGMMILYVLGLQTWTKYSNTAMHYLYYVSLIWGIFIMYALFKTTILTERLNNAMKAFVCACLVGFLVGMYIYHPGGGFHPPLGSAYFALGFLSAVAYSYLLKRQFEANKSRTPATPRSSVVSSSCVSTDEEILSGASDLNNNSSVSNNSNYQHTIHSIHTINTINTINTNEDSVPRTVATTNAPTAATLAPTSATSDESHHHNDDGNQNYYNTTVTRADLWNYLPAIATDILAFFLLFVIFYNPDFPSTDPNNLSTFRYHASSGARHHSAGYRKYDTFMLLCGVPVLFCLMMIAGFLQTKASSQYSLMTWITQSYPIVLIGECSLPIYIFQLLFLQYWGWGIDGIAAGRWPYTRTFILHTDHNQLGAKNAGWKLFGVVIAVAIAIFMQKVYQDRFVTHLHLKLMNYLAERKARAAGELTTTTTTNKSGKTIVRKGGKEYEQLTPTAANSVKQHEIRM